MKVIRFKNKRIKNYGQVRPNDEMGWVDEYVIRGVKTWRPYDPCEVCYEM